MFLSWWGRIDWDYNVVMVLASRKIWLHSRFQAVLILMYFLDMTKLESCGISNIIVSFVSKKPLTLKNKLNDNIRFELCQENTSRPSRAADVIYHPSKFRNRLPFELKFSATTHFKGFVEMSSLPLYLGRFGARKMV